jgi:cell division initiation protein
MSLTPVEIRHVRLGRRPLGYDRRAADRLLEEIADSFEDVWRERADLADEIERLEEELARSRELEGLLRDTLVSAERAAEEMRSQARKEAELILGEARGKARAIAFEAESERERIEADIRRLKALESEMRSGYRAFLVSALDRIESTTDERQASGQAA